MIALGWQREDRMDPWIWAVLLVGFGLALALLEVFVPSGGILVRPEGLFR